MGKNLHEQNKQLASICMCCFNRVREGLFYGYLPEASQICSFHNTALHQELAQELKRWLRRWPTYHLLVFAVSLNTYIKQVVLQLSRGGEALLTQENFAITASKPDNPVVSEGIVSERNQGLISNTSINNLVESQESQNLDAADSGPVVQDIGIIRSYPNWQSCHTHSTALHPNISQYNFKFQCSTSMSDGAKSETFFLLTKWKFWPSSSKYLKIKTSLKLTNTLHQFKLNEIFCFTHSNPLLWNS